MFLFSRKLKFKSVLIKNLLAKKFITNTFTENKVIKMRHFHLIAIGLLFSFCISIETLVLKIFI
jgi:hypothetical protein